MSEGNIVLFTFQVQILHVKQIKEYEVNIKCIKGTICNFQKCLVNSDTCGREINESQRRARACAHSK